MGKRKRGKAGRALQANDSNNHTQNLPLDSLPVIMHKDSILEAIASNNVTIVVGETGSGKTTQIPQLLHSHYNADKVGMQSCRIVITQPRRVAAISIAKRVSQEMGCQIGSIVGYTIRFEDVTSKNTMIKFVTDGMLLRELLNDRLLSRYKIIILDEAHERTLRTDILFGAIKLILKTRKDLKLVIMSATLNAKSFSTYFDHAPVINIPGRQHSVTHYFASKKQSDFLNAALVTVFQIHESDKQGDILVFLTGQEDIENLEKLIIDRAKSLDVSAHRILVCPIFASLPTSQQVKVFEQTPKQTRKIVISTNIAETSITIPGIRFVVDAGMVKSRGYNPKTGIETLNVESISIASANQRAGRAGREAPGFCYRLYTESLFKLMVPESEPEISRCNLSNVILLLKASGIEDIAGFDFMDSPSRASLVGALEQLYALQALDDSGHLTALGRQMSLFPVEPSFAKLLIKSKSMGCTQEAITIVSMLSIDPIFYSSSENREESTSSKKLFINYDGDHLTLLNVFNAYSEIVEGRDRWCLDHYISARSMRRVMDIRKQLVIFCKEQGIDPAISCGSQTDSILKCLVSGFFKNIAVRQIDGTFKTLGSREIVYLHPSSVLFQSKAEVVLFTEWVKTTRQYLRGVSSIRLSWLAEVAPHYYGRKSLSKPS